MNPCCSAAIDRHAWPQSPEQSAHREALRIICNLLLEEPNDGQKDHRADDRIDDCRDNATANIDLDSMARASRLRLRQ
jgi:hypothetical protein